MWQPLCPAVSLSCCQQGAGTCFDSTVALLPLPVKSQGHQLLTFIWLHLTGPRCPLALHFPSMKAAKLNTMYTLWPQSRDAWISMLARSSSRCLSIGGKMHFCSFWMFQALLIFCVVLMRPFWSISQCLAY